MNQDEFKAALLKDGFDDIDVRSVEPPLVADLDDEVGTLGRRFGKAIVARDRRRARLLEEEVLSGGERGRGDFRVVD